MTEEKYLEIRGFKYVGAGNWQWPPTSALFTQEGALKCQLQEDRDLYNFVRERSTMVGRTLRPLDDPAETAALSAESDAENAGARAAKGNAPREYVAPFTHATTLPDVDRFARAWFRGYDAERERMTRLGLVPTETNR